MLPHIQREKNKKQRKKELRKKEEEVRRQKAQPFETTSKTAQKKIDREERRVQEKAELRLENLDKKWGLGLGPFKVRWKWMGKLFGK